MARKKEHEDHVNHEAWAIPYGDLVTLLLAFFVVMYAVSSLNEGKYRTLADSLAEAFGGPQRSMKPVQLGKIDPRGSAMDAMPALSTPGAKGAVAPVPLRDWPSRPQIARSRPRGGNDDTMRDVKLQQAREQLGTISLRVEAALSDLIDKRLVTLRRSALYLEIEIRSDILFASGDARPAHDALSTLQDLGAALQPFGNPVRIEGHTDDVPIHTLQYPTNWELSAARAASVLRLFVDSGVQAQRLAVIGYGAVRPARDNGDAEGRAANRRVVVVVLADPAQSAAAAPNVADVRPMLPARG